MALTPELETYFDNLDELFGTQGWRQLIDDATKEVYQLQANALEARNFEELCFMKGQADILNRILTLREVSDVTRASHAEEDEIATELAHANL